MTDVAAMLETAVRRFVAEHLPGLDPGDRDTLHNDPVALVIDRDGRPSYSLVGPEAFATVWFVDTDESAVEGYTWDPVADREHSARVETETCECVECGNTYYKARTDAELGLCDDCLECLGPCDIHAGYCWVHGAPRPCPVAAVRKRLAVEIIAQTDGGE